MSCQELTQDCHFILYESSKHSIYSFKQFNNDLKYINIMDNGTRNRLLFDATANSAHKILQRLTINRK